MDAKEIGRKLRELRGVFRTQDEVAKAIGIDRSVLSLYENGERIPTDRVKLALAEYYGVTVGALFFAEERHDSVKE